MCGISGIYNFDQRPVDADLLRRMNDTMVHRGPDGSGVFVKGPIGLGHRRLSIIDLHTGDQPMATHDGQLQVVFNGEIYNFLELRDDLEKRGHVFRTRSDTETILHGYREWGDDFVTRLRGMFAIALWDGPRQRLLLIRDRLGKKPLYYHCDGRRLVFGSEMKALLADPSIARELDPAALDAYLSFGYVPSPLSIFKGIRKLPPAHQAVSQGGTLEVRSYWDLDMNGADEQIPEKQAVEELTTLFDESVRLRMISDVPLGAFLSGGVDSSAVVAAMAGLTDGNPVRTAAIGFADKRFNELDYARMVAERYQTEHREFVVEPDALAMLERLVWHFDEPFADSSAIPTWYVSKMTRQNVTVALSGDGGDETFAGYTQRYSMNRFEDAWRQKIPGVVRQPLLGTLAKIYPRVDYLPRPLRLKAFLTNLSLPLEQAYFRDMSFYFKPEAKQRLLNQDLTNAMGVADSASVLGRHFARNRNSDVTSRVQYVDIKTYLPEDILVKVDRMSMAHSLEVRAPILDHKVMEYAARLPSSLKLRDSEAKYVFKQMNRKRLPNDVLYRKKQGFCVPLATWLRGDLKALAHDAIFGDAADLRQWFDMSYVAASWNHHQSGRQDNATPLWGLVMLGLWKNMMVRR